MAQLVMQLCRVPTPAQLYARTHIRVQVASAYFSHAQISQWWPASSKKEHRNFLATAKGA